MQHSRILMAAILAGAGCVAAQADTKVVVTPASEGGTNTEAALTVDTKIMFSGTSIRIDNGGNITEVPFADAEKIYFSGITSLGAVEGESAFGIRRNPVGDRLELTGYAGTPVSLTVTSLSGQVAAQLPAWAGETIDVSSLAPGIYLVTINNETLKFIKK